MARQVVNLTGRRFGKLVAFGRAANGVGNKTRWHCVCDCGNTTVSYSNNLLRGKSQSCGCVRKTTLPASRRIHGGYKSRLFRIWLDMRARCTYPSTDHYHRYGGRGITVCAEWQSSFIAFRDWALQNGYAENLTIDRINNDGNYEPGNCRWVTIRENCQNRGSTAQKKVG